MAKKKKRKESKKNTIYMIECKGMLSILIFIIGNCNFTEIRGQMS